MMLWEWWLNRDMDSSIMPLARMETQEPMTTDCRSCTLESANFEWKTRGTAVPL